jgi:integrase
LTPIWSTIPETARRIQKRIELILDYATAHGMRQGDNPARWGTLKHILPELRNGRTNHHPALRYKDLPAFMTKLRQDSSVQSLALQFVILTACRIGEALGASWSEFEGGTWNIPAERMKGARAHRVALSRAALEVLERLPRIVGESHLFPGRGGAIRPLTVQRLLKALVPTGATLHGFRATFSTWANEQTKTPPHIVESCLAHQVSGAVERSYNRSDWLAARAALLEQWGRYCFPDDRG